jgi:hypothetical protein
MNNRPRIYHSPAALELALTVCFIRTVDEAIIEGKQTIKMSGTNITYAACFATPSRVTSQFLQVMEVKMNKKSGAEYENVAPLYAHPPKGMKRKRRRLLCPPLSVLKGDEAKTLRAEAPDQISVGSLHVLRGQPTAHALHTGRKSMLALEVHASTSW